MFVPPESVKPDQNTNRPPAGILRLAEELPIPAWIQRAILEKGVPEIEAEVALNHREVLIGYLCNRGKKTPAQLISGTPSLSTINIGRFPVVALGDCHSCNPVKIVEDLIQTGVLNDIPKWNPVFKGKFYQVGDTVDRGVHGLAVYDLMEALQDREPLNVGRLLGNHEVAHLFGYENQIGAPSISGFRQRLRADILCARVVAALVEGNTLYTHAGIDIDFFPEYQSKTPIEIADDLNFRLQRAVLSDSEKDPIFNTERGIFWKRDENGTDLSKAHFNQVVGHTPQRNGIRADPGMKVKYIDAGRVFGEIHGTGFSPVQAREMMLNTEQVISSWC